MKGERKARTRNILLLHDFHHEITMTDAIEYQKQEKNKGNRRLLCLNPSFPSNDFKYIVVVDKGSGTQVTLLVIQIQVVCKHSILTLCLSRMLDNR